MRDLRGVDLATVMLESRLSQFPTILYPNGGDVSLSTARLLTHAATSLRFVRLSCTLMSTSRIESVQTYNLKI